MLQWTQTLYTRSFLLGRRAGQKVPPPSTRDSPALSAKTFANARITHTCTPLHTHPLAFAAPSLSAQSEGTSCDDEETGDDDNEVEYVSMFQRKSTGDSILDGGDVDLGDISYGRHDDDNDDDNLPTDAKVSKFTCYQRLTHYMNGAKKSQQNRKAVEHVILVEAGTTIQNMDPFCGSTCK
jgi:hypothetical protein